MTATIEPGTDPSSDGETRSETTLAVAGPLRRSAAEHRREVGRGAMWRLVEGALGAVPLIVVAVVAAHLVDGSLDNGVVALASVVVAGAVVAELGAAWRANRWLFAGAFDVGRALRRRLVSVVRLAPVGDVLDRPRGEVTTTIARDVDDVQSFLNGSLPGLASGVGALGVTAVAVVVIDPLVGATLILACGLVAVAHRAKLRRQARHTALRSRLRAAQDERVVEFIQGVEVAKAFGMRGRLATQVDDALRGYQAENLRSVRTTIPMSATVAAGGALLAGVVLAIAGWRADAGDIEPGNVAALIVIVAGATRALLALGSSTGALPGTAAALRRIDELLAIPPRRRPADGPRPDGLQVATETVGFAYGDAPVLTDVSFVARQGATTAVVGRSGAGKTTLLQILAGLRDPARGRVTIGGTDLAELSDGQRAALLSVVLQDPWLPDGTVRTAIAGDADPVDDARLDAVIDAARCGDVIDALPDGLDTEVGEGGRNLSGGQRQRIAIARALFVDAPVVLLDEATASLDASSERALHESLDALRAERTLIVVAHRPSTIRRADHIVVLDDGRIVESGAHDDLVAAGGLYARRWALRERTDTDGFGR
ncbi:MAG: ABC transporter ATP-binding protein [Actinomycetota bacterium]